VADRDKERGSAGDRGAAPGLGDLVAQARRSALALVALPEAGVEALRALGQLPPRLDRLIELLEATNGAVRAAALGAEAAASGLASTAEILRRVSGLVETALPPLTGGAGALAEVSRRLSETAGDLAADLPRVVRRLDEVSPELAGLATALDGRLENLDKAVAQLGSVVSGAVAAIPGLRRSLRGLTEPGADQAARPSSAADAAPAGRRRTGTAQPGDGGAGTGGPQPAG
jgi:ABC-type transporter Mla subunit MlaD